MAPSYQENARTQRSPVVMGFGLNTKGSQSQWAGVQAWKPGIMGSLFHFNSKPACSSSQALLQDVLKRCMPRENRGQADHVLEEWPLNYQLIRKCVKDADSQTPSPTLFSHPWNLLLQQADQVFFMLSEIWGPLLASWYSKVNLRPASSGRLLEMQNPRPHLRTPEPESAFSQDPQDFPSGPW